MTKQEIIDIICECVDKESAMPIMSIYDYDTADIRRTLLLVEIADTLLAKIEQEKKEQVRDIFERCVYISKEFNHKGVYKRLVDIAKEYGVEL